MSRYARGKEPYAPKMEHVEVPESHVRLRAILFVLAILLAVVAFGFGLNSLLTPETGWKAVEASGSNSGEITLQYNYGAGAQGTAAERRQVSDVYSTALTQAEQQLSQAGNNTVSLYTVSTNPNQTVTVEPILYRALERFCATGSRAKGAVAALVSGLAEPAGAVLAALVLAPLLTPGLLNGIVAVVAGIMLWVAAAQLLPAAFEPAWRKMGVTGFCTGVLMMILGIAALA